MDPPKAIPQRSPDSQSTSIFSCSSPQYWRAAFFFFFQTRTQSESLLVSCLLSLSPSPAFFTSWWHWLFEEINCFVEGPKLRNAACLLRCPLTGSARTISCRVEVGSWGCIRIRWNVFDQKVWHVHLCVMLHIRGHEDWLSPAPGLVFLFSKHIICPNTFTFLMFSFYHMEENVNLSVRRY